MMNMDVKVLHPIGVMFLLCLYSGTDSLRLPDVAIEKAVVISSKTISLSWKPSFIPKRENLHYTVRYKPKGGQYKRIHSTKPTIVLKGLKPNVTYQVAVRASIKAARGGWSKTVELNTTLKNKNNTFNLAEGTTTTIQLTDSSALIRWNVSGVLESTQPGVFQVVLKSRRRKKEVNTNNTEIHTTDSEINTTNTELLLVGLESDSSYVVIIYFIGQQNSGKKTTVGIVNFQTFESPVQSPRKFKIKSVTDSTLTLKWKHLMTSSKCCSVIGYMLQYTATGIIMMEEICTITVDSSTKTFTIKGLLPEAKYVVRVAGLYSNASGKNNFMGPFTDWLKVRTLSLDQTHSDIDVYHISFDEVLLKWWPSKDFSKPSIDIYKEDNNSLASFVQTIKVTELNVAIIGNLSPSTVYTVYMKSNMVHGCTMYKTLKLQTSTPKCLTECSDAFLPRHGILNELSLRVIPLPGNRHLITWSPWTGTHNSCISVLRIFGETFSKRISTNYIPDGLSFHVYDGIDYQQRYSIHLQVFDSDNGARPIHSQYLLLRPLSVLSEQVRWAAGGPEAQIPILLEDDFGPPKDIPEAKAIFGHSDRLYVEEVHLKVGDNGSVPNSTMHSTSMDLILQSTIYNESEFHFHGGEIVIQKIGVANMTLISKQYPFDDITVYSNTIEEQISFLKRELPFVYAIKNSKIKEGQPINVTCLSRGDPYPIITWLNITANDTIPDVDRVTSNTVSVSAPHLIGLSRLYNNRAFLGAQSVLVIKNAQLSHTGIYACEAENMVGSTNSIFSIVVTSKPPGPVRELKCESPTPFDIFVFWKPPIANASQRVINLIGYHIVLLDEYGFKLEELNTTRTNASFPDMTDASSYMVRVDAFHRYDQGPFEQCLIKTRSIPMLGSPQNVTVKTRNSKTFEVSWLPPAVVIERQVRLRTFLFHYRKEDAVGWEEMPLRKMFTNVSIIDLEPDQRYEVCVFAMSEDGQKSPSSCQKGNTSRESYMEETRAPPPPRNVFLRAEGDNIIVAWLPPFPDENILVREYTIDVLHNGTRREAMMVGYKESSVIVYEVANGVIYQISVRAKNNFGTSIDQWEEIYIPVVHVTDEPVQNFIGVALSSTVLELRWESPASGVYSHFVLSYTYAADQKPQLPGSGNLPASVRSYIVRSLKPYTEYLFNITPYLKNKKGVTASTTVRTLSDKPQNVALVAINSTTVQIRAEPPETGKNGKIHSYMVMYQHRKKSQQTIVVAAKETESLQVYLKGLEPATLYQMKLRALTVNGNGPWTEWISVETLRKEPILPKVPKKLTVSSTSTTISLRWLPPEQDDHEITGYIVGYGKYIPEVFRISLTKDKNSYIFENLEPKSVYIISARTFNDFGESAAVFELVTTKA